jgi:AbrB family looped-hinge helix DNA binding protein
MSRKRSERNKKPGLSEDSTPYVSRPKPVRSSHATVELAAGGRLVIPAAMRTRLGMKVGDRLTVRLEGNELRIHTYEEGLRQAREIVAKYLPPDADPVEDFLQWKREQAKTEKAKYEKWSRGE